LGFDAVGGDENVVLLPALPLDLDRGVLKVDILDEGL
jgi:hypothetical protein